MWYVLFFFFMFQISFIFQAGGINIRSYYALSVSDGVFSFFKNYVLSFGCTHKQIHTNKTFYPEVNAKLEKLLAMALDGAVDVGWSGSSWRDDKDEYQLRIVRPREMGGNTLQFFYNVSNIEGEDYLLSPTVFILANKVVQKLHDKKDKEKKERQRNII